MTTDDKPGLKIRRKRDEAEAEAKDNVSDKTAATVPADEAESQSAAATEDTGSDAGAAPGSTEPAAASDRPAAAEAPRPKAPSAADASPAPSTPPAESGAAQPAAPPVTLGGAAVASDTRKSKSWRAEVALPTIADSRDEAPVARRDEPMPTTDDFAAMLGDAPLDVRAVEVGEKVSASVVAIGSDAVFVSLGGKAEGAIDRPEVSDEDGNLLVGIGDTIEAYVVSMRDGIRLSKALSKGDDHRQMLVDAHAQGIPVEGRVTGTNKGGFDVDVLGTRAFCPFSQMDLDPGTPPEVHVGSVYNFLVSRAEEEGRNVVVSRRALLEREREQKATATLAEIRTGAEFEGTVTRIADFGAFVDIGGLDGLVHVSEMSYVRLDHPSEMVHVGDTVRVSVLGATDLDDPRNRRVSLSMKALQEDPWIAGVRELTIGDTITGRVVRMEGFGAFVEIGHGLDGLVHISEISPGRRINHPREILSVGDDVQVQILKIDPSRRQIGLSIKALMDDPWSVAARDLPVGTTVQGTVDSVQSFGVFVALPGGINGLLPMSQLPDDEAKNVYNRFRAGTDVEARVLAVDPARQRLTLTRREDSESEARQVYESYKAERDVGGGLGTFADLLKNRK